MINLLKEGIQILNEVLAQYEHFDVNANNGIAGNERRYI